MTIRRTSSFALLGSIAVLGGCFALDWDYESGPGAGGSTAASSSKASGASSGAAASGGAGEGGSGSGGADGGGLLTTPFYGEGSRLKANYYDYGGGATQFISWFDTLLGVSCTFMAFDSGDVACVPSSNDASSYYADVGCTQRLISYPPNNCGAPNAYGSLGSTTTSCETPSGLGSPGGAGYASIHSAGVPFAGATVYTKDGNNVCTSSMAPAMYQFKALGPALPPSMFVTAQRKKEARGPILSEEIFQGEDGSWQLNRPKSNDRNCSLQPIGGLELCLSNFNGNDNTNPFFTDAGCSVELAGQFGLVRTNICPPADYIRARTTDMNGCLIDDKFYAVGAPTSLPPLWTGMPGSCSPFTPSNFSTVSLGAPLPLSTFGAATAQTIGAQRIQATYFGTGANEPLGTPNTFVDTTDGHTCSVVHFDDGAYRCVESDVMTSGYYFGDATCSTTPLVLYSPNPCVMTKPPTRALRISPIAQCGGAATGLSSLTSYVGKVYTKQNATTCVLQTLGPTTLAFSLAADIPMTFAPVLLVQH